MTGPERLERWFPKLVAGGYRITSVESPDYNCLAWAVGDGSQWWEPVRPPQTQYYWPTGAPLDDSISSVAHALQLCGYESCLDGGYELNYIKVAIYGSEGVFQHAARLTPTGSWASKIGCFEDIEHDSLELLEGDEYGNVVAFLRKPETLG